MPAHVAATRSAVVLTSGALRAARALRVDETVSRLRGDTSEGAITGSSDFLEWMVESAIEGDPEAVARNTRLQQNSNWKAWCRYCSSAGVAPWRPALASENAEREKIIWGAAFFYVYAKMKPKKGNYIKDGPLAGQLCPPKPQSAMAVLRGARKEHLERGIEVPPLSLAARRCKEVLRRYAEYIGPENIVPNRKAPMTRELIISILRIANGDPLMKDGRSWQWDTQHGHSCRALVHTLAQTGMRKAEVAIPAKVRWGTMHLSFANLMWLVRGKLRASVTAEVLLTLTDGDYAVIRPPPSKADAFGLRWGNNPVYLPFDATAGINAARALAQWELCARVHPEQRKATPLFCDREGIGSALREDTLTETFFRWVRWCTRSDEEARRYSIHSFRSYLCSALMASGRSDAEIQLALRWASDDALKIYKVANVETYASWLHDAERQRVTGMRAVSLPRQPPEHDHLDRARAILAAGRELEQYSEAADTPTGGVEPTTVDYDVAAMEC